MKVAILYSSVLIARTIDVEAYNKFVDENAIGFPMIIIIFIVSDLFIFFNNLYKD